MSVIRRVPGAVGVRPARQFVAASSQYLTAPVAHLGISANGVVAIGVLYHRVSAVPNSAFAALTANATRNDSRRIWTLGTDGYASSFDNAYTTANSGGLSTGAAGVWRSVVGEFASATSRRLAVGTTWGTTGTTAITLTNAPTVLCVGVAATGDTGYHFDGGIARVALWGSVVTDTLLSGFSRGVHPATLPGQLLECWDLDRVGPIRGLVRGTVLSPTNGGSLAPGPAFLQGPPVTRRLYFDVGAGGSGTAYSLTADAGSYSVTGSDASPRVGRRLSGDAGSYSLTGSAADTRVGRRLSGDAGSYALTGSDASPRVGRVLSADAAAYAVTGSAASTLVGRRLSADAGSYASSGTDAALRRTYVLTVDPGAYELTGAVASLVKVGALEVTADPGVYALTGADALLRVTRVLSADPGSYTSTGSDATAQRTWVLAADAGSYGLTGASATLNASNTIVPDIILVGTITQSVLATVGTITTAEGLAVGTITTLPGDA